MFCTKCGAEREEGAKFCAQCGAQFKDAYQKEKNIEAAAEINAPNLVRTAGNKKGIIIATIACIVIASIAAAVIVYLNH